MRLFSGKIAPLSEELVEALVAGGDIECESKKEVVLDVQSVFTSYLQQEREVTEKAKSTMEARGLPQSEFARVKKLAAEQKGIKVGDDLLDFLLDQLIEMLLHSGNVDEVFAQDHDLRRRMRPVLKKHLEVEEALESEVRGQLKHLQEGTSAWDVEFGKTVELLRRSRGLI